jgi:hypothetical protein
MIVFKILWAVDLLACLVVLYFFFTGMADGSVSAKNMGLWMMILLVFGIVMFGSSWLRSHYPSIATALLGIVAIPALGYLLFLLAAIFGKSKWN